MLAGSLFHQPIVAIALAAATNAGVSSMSTQPVTLTKIPGVAASM
jgi:hypothetical protein